MSSVAHLRRTEKAAKREQAFAKRMRKSTPRQRGRIAGAQFMVKVGQHKRVSERRCQHTMPLFPLWLILDADGTLNADVAQTFRAGP